MDNKDVNRLTRNAIKTLKIPRTLWEDAEQEAWLATLQGKKILTELTKWMRHERYHYKARKKIEGFAEVHPGSIEQAEKELE